MKTFVLDSNILLTDPEAMFKFEEHNVTIPLTVVEEIDFKKKDPSELGRNARQVARNLRDLALTGKLNEGILLPGGGLLKVEISLERVLTRLPIDLSDNINDNRILAVAIETNGILVTNDANLAIKANALNIEAQQYENQRVNVDHLYTGTAEGYVSGRSLDQIYDSGVLGQQEVNTEDEPLANQSFILHNSDSPKQSALATYNKALGQYELLPQDLKTLGLFPKNSEQQFALNHLLNPDISIVSLIGLAGSGKTLCALAAALHGVLETKMYKKVLLLKPIVSMDNAHKVGFLPGDLLSKLAPWAASYMDNIDFIMGEAKKADEMPKIKPPKKPKGASEKFSVTSNMDEKNNAVVSMTEELIAMNLLEIGSLEHIRGRSLPNQFIILDECQNMTINSLKTVITRAGEGSKIICMGDIEQCDVPYLDASSNGLSYLVDKFKGQDCYAHVTLEKSVRSPLAELAARLL